MNESTPTPSSTTGHRERLRARFLAGDASAMTDAALLELLLTYSIPRRDVRPLAESLLGKFGSAEAVLSAAAEDLLKVPGIKDTSAILLKLVKVLQSAGAPPEIGSTEPVNEPEKSGDPEPDLHGTGASPEPSDPPSPKVQEKETPPKRTEAPKLQVSNGYSLDAAQTARLLTHIADHPEVKRFARRDLMEGTGLAEGQVESLTSIGAGIGLVAPVTARLTPLGELVLRHDLFLDASITLEFCHFLGAGNPRNLVWHAIFNEILPHQTPTDQAGWSALLREQLADSYSKRSLVKHVASEVRFVLDAYTVRNFKKLNLIYETPDKTLALRRYTALAPHSLAAMIYWVGDQHEARLVSFDEIQAEPGSPGRVFGLDASSMKQMVEALHQKGWIRYEVRHGLDQIRLIDGFEPLEFLAAGYESREPEPKTTPENPGDEPLLL